MKKILLAMMGIMCLPLFMNAQNTRPSVDIEKTITNINDGRTLAPVLAEKRAKRTNGKTRGGSRNYLYLDAIGNLNGDLFDQMRSFMWQDSTIAAYFGTTTGFPFIKSAGQVFDPTAPIYNNASYVGEIEIGDGNAYTLDSVTVRFVYNRNPTKTAVVDTMIVSITNDASGNTTGTDIVYFYENQPFIKTNWFIDSMYIATPYYDFTKNGILSARSTEYKIPLTVATENDTLSSGWNFITLAPNRSIPAGHQVGVTYSFKSGDTWIPLVDTITSSTGVVNFNHVTFPSFVEDGGSARRLYQPIDMNFSSLVNTDTSGWGNLFIPSVYYNNPFFDYHFIDFDVTCASCGPVGVKDFSKLEGVKVYPNPTNGIVNLSLDNALSNKEISVTVLDLSGKTIYSESFTSTSSVKSIDLKNTAKGIYMYSVKSEGKVAHGKLVIE